MLKLTAADAIPPPDVKRAKYRQLADAIRAQIADGYLQPGQSLPSETDIGVLANVARSVVRQALDLLQREGLIQKQTGVTARVAGGLQVTPASQARPVSMTRYVEQNVLIAEGKRPDTSAFADGHGIGWDEYSIRFHVAHERATPKDRELLRLPAGAWVWRRTFLKMVNGIPVELQRSALPEWVVEGNPYMVDPDRQPYRGGTQWELYDGGFHVRHVHQSTLTRMPTENEERDLAISKVAVLEVERVMSIMHNSKLRPVESSRLILVGSRHVLVEDVKLGKVDTKRGGLPGA